MLNFLRSALLIALLPLLSAYGFSQTQLTSIRQYLQDHSAEWGLQPKDVETLEILSEAPSKAKGVSHVYIRQLLNGIPVSNGLATITVKDGKVVHVASRLKGNLTANETSPELNAAEALKKAASALGITSSADPEIHQETTSGDFIISAEEWSAEPIPATLVYVAANNGQLRLAWNVAILTTDKEHWWSARISATNGELIERNDWISHCSVERCTDEHDQHTTDQSLAMVPPPPPGADQYFVYALPLESPAHGNRSMITNPSDPAASPYGWHDTDGIPGDEFTITRGNNVYASDDINDDNDPGYSPDGGTALNFDFPYDSAVGVQGNLDAVITNLFYMNNMMHDIWYPYGFDEPSGNFQQTNYSGTGLGSDFVFADAQDGSGTNNANFGTPPDGEHPRMQMYLWSNGNDAPDLLTVNSPAGIAQTYSAVQAGFGPPVPSLPLTSDFVIANDGDTETLDACQPIVNTAEMNGKIALVLRGNCTFESKVENCQAAGATAVIVINNVANAPISMGGSTGGAVIPAVMVSQADGNLFLSTINGGSSVNGTLVNTGDLTATDSDFDNMIIAHEYGHGISTRLTGGAANSDCLWNAEQMGEGWSDWFGLMLTIEPGDVAGDPRGVGTYVTNEPNDGTGIRPAPYSTDFAVNSYTYSATNNSNNISEPHGIGFVWATMLWDLNWALIDQYGFDPDVQHGTGGNNKAMALVIEGLKLQPCMPGFVDGRDAILQADELLYNGENQCLIWEVFARRGLGLSADQGSSENRTDQTQAFDLPESCIQGMGENGLDLISIHPNPTKDVIVIDMKAYNQVTSIRITDLQGKTVFETTAINSPEITVNLAGFRSGLYLVQLTDTHGARSIEIVKHE